MTIRTNCNPVEVLHQEKTKIEDRYSQTFMANFLASGNVNNVEIKKTVENSFHFLVMVEDINSILAQLRDNNLLEEPVSHTLQKLKKSHMSNEHFLALSTEIQLSIKAVFGEEVVKKIKEAEEIVSEEVETSSTKKVLTEKEVKIIKEATEAFCKIIVMQRLIAKFVADGDSLPVVQKTIKGGYTAPIKIVIKDCHNSDILAFHTKVLPTDQSESGGGLPFIRHGISDEGTFRRYPQLKDKIPHSSYTLFPSSLTSGMDGAGDIFELAGMKKITGLDLVDEDLGEDDEGVMARVSQSSARSRAQTSLAERIKVLDKAEKTMDVYVTEKANGAYAACQVFCFEGKARLFVSSKVAPLIFTIPEGDTVEGKGGSLLAALKKKKVSEGVALDPLLEFIARESIQQLSQCKDRDALFDPSNSFWQGGMCVGEAELGDHIIPLTGDSTIRWFKQTGLPASVSIREELEKFNSVGLCTVKHYSIGTKDLTKYEKKWRGSKTTEGVVVYYEVDGKFYQTKYKSIPYIILRALREFLTGKRAKEFFSLIGSKDKKTAVLSLANRPKHVEQVIAHLLDNHPHLLALGNNTEFDFIVKENIKAYKEALPEFIKFLLGRGNDEKDLAYGNAYGFAKLYENFNEWWAQAKKGGMIKEAEGLSSGSRYFQGIIIALSGPPGVGKDTVAEKLATDSYWENNKPLILSKDLATKAFEKDKSYGKLTQSAQAKKRFQWLAEQIKQAVEKKRPIITTTCNGSPQELIWITEAAKKYNLAVMPVYPNVSKENMTAFSAALIVSVLRRQGHATLSASTGEAGATLNSKFAQVIKRRINNNFYTHVSADGEQRIPASDFYDKYLPTQSLSYFELSAFNAFLAQTSLSEEQAKIQGALVEVDAFLNGKKQEISTDSLAVLRDAPASAIEKIFTRTKADNLGIELMKKICQLEQNNVYWRQQETVMALKDDATYCGAFLDSTSATMLKAAVSKAFLSRKLELPNWIKIYCDTSETAELDATQLKNSKKKKVDRDRLPHLTLAHAGLLHNLSREAFFELERMREENVGKGPEIKLKLKVSEISYNEGVLYASDVLVLCQKGSSNVEDKTKLFVASGMPHITLAMREGIDPVFALYAEQARKAGAQGIKTLCFDQPLILNADVRTNVQHARSYDTVKGRSFAVSGDSVGVVRQQKSEKSSKGEEGYSGGSCSYSNPVTRSCVGIFSNTKPAVCATADQVAVPLKRLH